MGTAPRAPIVRPLTVDPMRPSPTGGVPCSRLTMARAEAEAQNRVGDHTQG